MAASIGIAVGSSGDLPKPFLIGVAGGTASGKFSVCASVTKELGDLRSHVVTVSIDNFYCDLTPEEQEKVKKGQYNFDHPAAIDVELLRSTLADVKKGLPVQIPQYDYRTSSRLAGRGTELPPHRVVLVEGILAFYWPEVRDLFDMKLFVDTDADTRLARRAARDVHQRGRDLEHVLCQYMTFVKPAFEEFCFPTKKYADIIIPRGTDNTVAIDLIVQSIKDMLLQPPAEASAAAASAVPGCARSLTRTMSDTTNSLSRLH